MLNQPIANKYSSMALLTVILASKLARMTTVGYNVDRQNKGTSGLRTRKEQVIWQKSQLVQEIPATPACSANSASLNMIHVPTPSALLMKPHLPWDWLAL